MEANEQVSKAQQVRDYYDEGLSPDSIANRMGIPLRLVEIVLDNYDEDWRRMQYDESGDDFPEYLEYDDWKDYPDCME